MTDETKTVLVYDSHPNTKNLPACLLTWSEQRIHKIFYTLRKLHCYTEKPGSEFSRSRMNFFQHHILPALLQLDVSHVSNSERGKQHI